MHGGASFGGLGCFSLGENGGKFVMGTTLNWVHQFHCERKKKFVKTRSSFYKSSTSWLGFAFFIVFTFLPSQGSSDTCSCQMAAACSAADGEGLGQLCCLLAKPGGEKASLSPPLPSRGPCMRHGKGVEEKGALHLRACRCAAAEKRTPCRGASASLVCSECRAFFQAAYGTSQ